MLTRNMLLFFFYVVMFFKGYKEFEAYFDALSGRGGEEKGQGALTPPCADTDDDARTALERCRDALQRRTRRYAKSQRAFIRTHIR